MTPTRGAVAASGNSNDRLLAGRYEVGPLVARGGMGSVHQARDVRLGRTVALKRLRDDLASDPVARQRFQNEGRAAARLNHPNVVTVLDVGTDGDGVPFLVMEWLPGPTLAHELARGPLGPDRVRAVARQVLAALAEAHRNGVLHRDVKPSNIVFSPTGEAKLADFGIAKTVDGLDVTSTGDVIGTIRYAAPERLQGQPASAASDLYSLGVVLREALTGAPAFTSTAPGELAYEVCHAQLRPLPERELGPLATVVNRATARDPRARYDSAPQMAAALAPIADPADATTAVAPARTEIYPAGLAPAPTRAASRPPARRRAGAVVLAVLLLGLCAAAALGLAWRGRTDPTTPTAPATTTAPAPTTTTAPTSTPTTTPPTSVATTSPPTTPAPATTARPATGHGKPGKGKG